ncbi:MAG: septum formation protein Maf, partial [Elusimicrobia bacterium]|nr:septum formation protein Maf [Elusimicrobiota bacterium]
ILLKKVVPRFLVRVSQVPEPPPRAGVDVKRYVMELARQKALAVARSVPRGLVLGADTEVVRRGKVYGKPTDAADARRMLSDLSGKWHDVYTGLALAVRPGRRVWTDVFRTRVKMRSFSNAQLDRWSKKNHDKAGAYAAQARGNPFVDRYKGEYENVVGLPLRGLRSLLKKVTG